MPTRKTMNVSISEQQRAFVRRQVASGRFRSDSEVVREGLRLLEDEERRRRLEEELLRGLDSGEPIEVDERYWSDLKRRIAERVQNRGAEG